MKFIQRGQVMLSIQNQRSFGTSPDFDFGFDFAFDFVVTTYLARAVPVCIKFHSKFHLIASELSFKFRISVHSMYCVYSMPLTISFECGGYRKPLQQLQRQGHVKTRPGPYCTSRNSDQFYCPLVWLPRTSVV